MSLKLGKSFDRNYTLRLPFLNSFYDISIFFNKKSTFLLFGVEHQKEESETGIKINMFKNLESSRFCESFIELHNYRKNTLDILNQFKNIRAEYSHDISFVTNETITLAKIDIEVENGEKKSLFDCLNIYGFTMNSFQNEFLFIITERHNIITKFNKKIVRTSGIQIATSHALSMLDEYHQDSMKGKIGFETKLPTDEIIKME